MGILRAVAVWGGISRQAQAGFVAMRNTGFGYTHYTASMWASEGALRSFATSGVHRDAMKVSSRLAANIRTYTYEGDEIPGWPGAKSLLASGKGRVIRFDGSRGRAL